MRFLIVGAGASIEEFHRMGGDPKDCFPSIDNFGNRLFQESPTLQFVCAHYLTKKGIPFNVRILEAYQNRSGEIIKKEDMENSPLRIFLSLEGCYPRKHNVERLFEFIWNQYGENIEMWDELIYWGIYLSISVIQSQYFFENGVGYKKMPAGGLVCSNLTNNDIVLSLNYDVCFDLAVQQNFDEYCYAPNDVENEIKIYKPHGSLNLYVNRQRKCFSFCAPDNIPGTQTHPDPEGGEWKASLGILRPRLSKSYSQHPIANTILKGVKNIEPDVVTFWGVGLTDSDIDLMEIYSNACKHSRKVEFINASGKDFNRAQKLLDVAIDHYTTIENWLAKSR